MKKVKVKDLKKMAEYLRRDREIKKYGKLISLRPSLEHKNKKLYTRKHKHSRNYED